MTSRIFLTFALSFSLLTGCSSMSPNQYEHTEPKLDLFEYFEGQTLAWGQFQSRSGELQRRFRVDIQGKVDGDTLVLDEQFVYDDGETEQRIWTIKKVGENQYEGRAGDVIGKAFGQASGSVLNWRYTLDLPYKDSSIHVKFDDWMFLQTDNVMLNRAKVTKWGFRVGEVTLFFQKPDKAS